MPVRKKSGNLLNSPCIYPYESFILKQCSLEGTQSLSMRFLVTLKYYVDTIANEKAVWRRLKEKRKKKGNILNIFFAGENNKEERQKTKN